MGLKANSVALVTGASSGIGQSIAGALAKGGCKVILAARNEARLKQSVAEIGANTHPLPLDLTDPNAIEQLLDKLPAPFRSIDILVNNAGTDIGGKQRFDQGLAEDWRAILQTNIAGLMDLTRVIAPHMVRRGAGDIVNVTSFAAIRVGVDQVAYGTSKAAAHAFSDLLRADLGKHGIRVIEILPGTTRTEMATTRFRGDRARANTYYDSFNSVLQPDDITRAVMYALAQPRDVTVAQLAIIPSGRS